jgi:hypothetical protein
MRPRTEARWLIMAVPVIVAAGAKPGASSLPPGRQHLLTFEGDNTITFVPQANLNPFKIDYRARIEYIVDTRIGEEALARTESTVKKKASRKTVSPGVKAKRKDASGAAVKVDGVVDVSLHSSEMKFRQKGQAVMESRMSRSRFQGRIQPDAPILSVSANEAPPRLQEVLKSFDTPAASILLDESSNVIDRKFRSDGPLRAVVETLLSIHTPIPRDVAYWEAPTQLAMGHGQTAKGALRFEKVKESLDKTAGLVKVKVSGVLKAEGAVVGNLIKDGTYTVAGEQTYDPRSREWKSARWSVAVNNELANAGGQTVAHARGTMIVESKALDDSPSKTENPPAAKP